MIGRHHAMIGTAVSGSVLMFSGVTLPQDLGWAVTALAVGTLAALLPDIDGHDSSIRSNFGLGRAQIRRDFRRRRRRSLAQRIIDVLQWIVSLPLDIVAYLLPHRGPTHWGLTAVLLTVGAAFLVRSLGWHDWLWLCFGLGYASHIIADGLTVSGVPLYGPLYKRGVRFVPRFMTLRTGSMQEYMVVRALLLFLAVGLFAYYWRS